MSIRTSIQISNSTTKLTGQGVISRTPASDTGLMENFTVTGDVTLDPGPVTTIGELFIQCVSGAALLVSFDGTTYPIRLVANAGTLIPLSPGTEVQTIEPVDGASAVQSSYFTLEGASGTWAVWFNISGGGSGPEVAHTELPVAITAAMSKADVAAAINAAMAGSAPFKADFGIAFATPVITVTDLAAATRTPIADGAVATGFTLATARPGMTVPTVHLKSEGSSLVTTLVTSA